MKIIHVVCAAVVVAAGCTLNYPEPPLHPPRTTANDAADRMVAAHCERQRQCVDPAKAAEAVRACVLNETKEIEANFARNADCARGVDVAHLDGCLTSIRVEECSDDIDRAKICRSRYLCVD